MSVFQPNRNLKALRIKILLLFLIITGFVKSPTIQAQINRVPNLPGFDDKFIRFGFILAVNEMSYAIKPYNDINSKLYTDRNQMPKFLPVSQFKNARLYSVEYMPTLGFAVGIVSNLRINKYFDLRFVPQLSFGSRDMQYRYVVQEENVDTTQLFTDIIKIPSTYIDFPLVLKFKSKRIMDYRPYVFAGVNPNLDLASQANKKDLDNKDPKLYRSDLGGILGVGCDFYMNWFKFGVELQMLYGMRDMLKHENTIYAGGVDYIKSKIFQVTFTFE